jgi:ABC-type antimicrobial peptide transport system permease subunit
VRIVGVVGDFSQAALDVAPQPAVYGPGLQSSSFGQNLIIRTAGDPADLTRYAIDLIHSVDPNLPVEDIRTMASVRETSLAPRRLMALLLSLFAGLAVVVSGAGVIAMTAFVVAQRQREIGIRMALGAGAGNVVALISSFAFRAIATSLAIGGVVALGLSRSIAGLLWGVGTVDPVTYLVAAGSLAAGTAIAAWATARRAGAVDPVWLIRSS